MKEANQEDFEQIVIFQSKIFILYFSVLEF